MNKPEGGKRRTRAAIRPRAKRPSYKAAVYWIVANDDTDWVDRNDPLSVTAAMVADLFGVSDEKITADIRRGLIKERELRLRGRGL